MTLIDIYRKHGNVKVSHESRPNVNLGTILGVDNYFGFEQVVVKWEDHYTDDLDSSKYIPYQMFDINFTKNKFNT